MLGLVLVSGFASLGYEILWTRALLVHVQSSTYAFTVMLAVYLLGVGLGSTLAAGRAGRSERPLLGFALCQVGVAGVVLLGLVLFPDLETIGFAAFGGARPESFPGAVAFMFIQSGLVMLLPTLFMGATFPYAVAAYHETGRDVGASVGRLYATNTAGNIAGALVVGFVAIEAIGVRGSFLLLLAVELAVAAGAAARLTHDRRVLVGALAAAAALVLAADRLLPAELFYSKLAEQAGGEIVFYREGASDTVAVVESPDGKVRTLIYSDGRGAAGTWTLHWNLYLGHLPLVLHGDPKEVLHICIGSGNSLMAVSRHDVSRIDAVDLSTHLPEALSYFWTNEGVASHPAVRLVDADGRNFLMRGESDYDVISMEPPQLFSAGVVNLYTAEFYELVLDRLAEGGVVMQWLPSLGLLPEHRDMLIRAFADVFPHVTIWQQLDSPVLLLVGTRRPLALDLREVRRALDEHVPQRDMQAMGLRGAEDFLSFFRLGDASVRRRVADVDAIRDDRTVIDFAMPHTRGTGFGLNPRWQETSEDFRRDQREYASWRDPVRLVVPDRRQAERVEAARRARGADSDGQTIGMGYE